MGPDPQSSNVNLVEETRKQINRLFEEVARLAEMDIPAGDFYGEFLKRTLHALAAPAGAVWGRTAQGNLQLQFQINMKNVGLDADDDGRAAHDELLRQAVMNPRPVTLAPHSGMGESAHGPAPGNPTGYLLLLVPVVVDNQVAGLLEVWQAPDRDSRAVPGFIQFMLRMAELATRYIRNSMLRQMVGQQQLWVQLEAFARSIHGSLNPVEVGYLIANEARRLVECDRVSIGVRYAKKCEVEAISGADVVEKRSNLVQLMRALFDAVIAWGEKLVYSGAKDDTLPPDVLKALDAYLAESNSKLLVVLPLKDERQNTDDKDKKKPARSALLMECFEPAVSPEQMLARLEVVARHATPALYNAVEHRRIPFRFVWMPLAKVQEGLGGKTKAIITLCLVGVLILIGVLVFVPYPLKMDSKGQVLPEVRRHVYAPHEGEVKEFAVKPGDEVVPGQPLVLMYDSTLREKLAKLTSDIYGKQAQIETAKEAVNKAQTAEAKFKAQLDLNNFQTEQRYTLKERSDLIEKTNADGRAGHEGEFWIKAPEFPPDSAVPAGGKWTVLNSDFRENLIGRAVKPSDPLLRLGYKDGNWEIELKIPQKHIGQVTAAFSALEKGRKARALELIDRAAAAGALPAADAEELVRRLETTDKGTLRDPRLVEFLRGEWARDFEALLTQAQAEGKLTEQARSDLAVKGQIDGGRLADAEVVEFIKNQGGAGREALDEVGRLLEEAELDVDLLVKGDPTRTFKGRVKRIDIAQNAEPHKDENNEAEPMVLARVRLSGPHIDKDREDVTALAPHLLVSGTEVSAKIRCGTHRMGYSLFYGVWEFIYEKVVFFF